MQGPGEQDTLCNVTSLEVVDCLNFPCNKLLTTYLSNVLSLLWECHLPLYGFLVTVRSVMFSKLFCCIYPVAEARSNKCIFCLLILPLFESPIYIYITIYQISGLIIMDPRVSVKPLWIECPLFYMFDSKGAFWKIEFPSTIHLARKQKSEVTCMCIVL